MHRSFDGLIGQIFFNDMPFKKYHKDETLNITLSNFQLFSYSKNNHFNHFDMMPVHASETITTCDLKTYQDLFIYTFLLKNIKKGARILEIGGGESRIISSLNETYEFWNLDKLEGAGHGPKIDKNSLNHNSIKDYIGAFSKLLPDNYFDCVFSISVVEHFPSDKENNIRILSDINRILKEGGVSIHCVDAILFKDKLVLPPFVSLAKKEINQIISATDFRKISSDPNLWTLSKFAYYSRWFPITKKSYKKFGKPFSINIFWQKTNK